MLQGITPIVPLKSEATLGIRDKVLTSQVGLRGKNKLADRWDKHSYIVIDMPNEDVTVSIVTRKSGDSTVEHVTSFLCRTKQFRSRPI